jgi:hypothetical protein
MHKAPYTCIMRSPNGIACALHIDRVLMVQIAAAYRRYMENHIAALRRLTHKRHILYITYNEFRARIHNRSPFDGITTQRSHRDAIVQQALR